MNVPWRQSLTGRALLQITFAVGLIIGVATWLTYNFTFRAVEHLGLVHLKQYVSERAKREESVFNEVGVNLEVAKQTFLERYQAPDPPGYLDRWDKYFERCPDGAIRSRREFADNRRFSTLWMHKDTALTPELQRRILVLYDVCQTFIRAWGPTFNSLYASTPETANIGFDSANLPDWVYTTPADFDQNSAVWINIGFPKNNPRRALAWTPAYFDDNSGLYFVSACLPVDIDGKHLASFGHDIPIKYLLEETTRTDIPGFTHMVFRSDGLIIAHPEYKQRILESKGHFKMQDDPALRALYEAVSKQEGGEFAGYMNSSGVYYAGKRRVGPDWIFLTVLPRAILTHQALDSAQWVLWTGLASLTLALVFLAGIFRQRITRPMRQLLGVTQRISAGETNVAVNLSTDDELGLLASAFNRMAQQIAARDDALRQEKNSLERRVTERTNELTASEARIRTMLENAPEAIVVLDGHTGRFVDANENALKFFELDRDRLLQSGPANLSPTHQPDGRRSEELTREKIQAALDGAMPVFAWTHRNSRGMEIPCEVRLSRLPASGRELVIGTILDVTDRKQAEEQLLNALARERELGELKSNFISMVSHEFRTPLEVIMSSADILHRYLERLAPEERAGHLQSIQDSVERMSGMMEDVLLLGRFEAGRLQFQPDDLHLGVWCHQLLDEMRSATAGQCPIEMNIELPDPMVKADQKLLRHILTNLISNAVKYSAPGSPVRLRVRREGVNAVFEVADTGRGIPRADQSRLFEAFHRARNVGQISGTGLGLVIVKRGVDLHGGNISFVSEEGRGTTFTVRLPLFENTPPFA